MDMPDRCWKCSVCASYQESAFSDRIYWCCAKDKDVDGNTKPDWCPLKPLPKKYDLFDDFCDRVCDFDYEYGYNACIDEILGDRL